MSEARQDDFTARMERFVVAAQSLRRWTGHGLGCSKHTVGCNCGSAGKHAAAVGEFDRALESLKQFNPNEGKPKEGQQ